MVAREPKTSIQFYGFSGKAQCALTGCQKHSAVIPDSRSMREPE